MKNFNIVVQESAAPGNVQRTRTRTPPPITRPPRPTIPGRVPPTPVHNTRTPPPTPPIECVVEEPTMSREPCGANESHQEFTANVTPGPLQTLPKLEDYGSSDDLKELTVKQLKILLTINRVDFRGCIEKSELLDRVYRLWEDNKQHKDIPENMPTEELCKLCMDAPLDCVLLECGHIASCVNCGKKLAECPICRQYVVRVVKTFRA